MPATSPSYERRFSALEARTSRNEEDITALVATTSETLTRVRSLERRISRVEKRLDLVEVRLHQVEVRLDQVEVRLGRVERGIEAIAAHLGVTIPTGPEDEADIEA